MEIYTKLCATAFVAMSCLSVAAQQPSNPPALTWDAAKVGVIYAADQDKYPDVLVDTKGNPVSNWAPLEWGQTCVVSDDECADGAAAKRIDNLDFLPMQFSATLNVSDYKFWHMDIWPSEDCQLDFAFQNWWPGEKFISSTYNLKAGEWNSIDIDLSAFAWGTKNGAQERVINVFKMGGEAAKPAVDGQPFAKTIYITNIIVHNEGGSGIDDITVDDFRADEPAYNVYGQRVDENYKGIVIQKGRKFIRR